MNYARLTIIVSATDAPLARALAGYVAGAAAAGVWTVGLSGNGSLPASHFISSGAVGTDVTPVLTDGQVLFDAITAALDNGLEVPSNVGVTLADCESLVAGAVVVDLSDEGPLETLARLELQRIP